MAEESLNYGNESINYLGEIGGLRLRPESMLGSGGIEGAEHTVIEMIGNSLDEKNSGFGDKLDIKWFGDGRISVRDYGRGIPLGYNDAQGEYNWKLIYNRLYAGGKYTDFTPLKSLTHEDWKGITHNNYSEKFAKLGINYLFSVGLNGLGSTATCATAEVFLVKSYRDGKVSSMQFRAGVADWDELHIEDTMEENGTYVEWRPDPEVFSDADIPEKWLRNLCRDFSYSAGVTIEYTAAEKEAEIFQASDVFNMMAQNVENGYDDNGDINNLAVETSAGIYHNTESVKKTTDGTDYEVGVMVYDIAIGSTGESGNFSRVFVNNIAVRGGTPQEGFESAVAGFFSERAKERGIRLRPSDYAGSISLTASILANLTNYRNQTKDEISNQYIYTGINMAVSDMLRHAYIVGAPWIKKAVQRAFNSYEARMLMEQMKAESREVKKATSRPVSVKKFQPCRTYGKKGKEEETELWIVEGDSAGVHLLNSRDPNYQALYYLRGKGRNPMKTNAAEALTSNQEISDILSIIGMGNRLTQDADITKSKIGKVIIASDADRDGYHIRMLTFLILWVYVPDMLYSGKVYVDEPPLWRVDTRDGKKHFYTTDADFNKDRENLDSVGIVGSPHRYKGLGQMEEEDLAEVVMGPEKRILHQVKVDRDDTSIDNVLNILFGSDTEGRKRGILAGAMGEDTLDERMQELDERTDILKGCVVDDTIDVEQVVIG